MEVAEHSARKVRGVQDGGAEAIQILNGNDGLLLGGR
jgi:hypothetical protein